MTIHDACIELFKDWIIEANARGTSGKYNYMNKHFGNSIFINVYFYYYETLLWNYSFIISDRYVGISLLTSVHTPFYA